MADKKAILKAGDKEVELPILSGTAGNDVIDVRSLGASGYFTYDPGFMATGSCESSPRLPSGQSISRRVTKEELFARWAV